MPKIKEQAVKQPAQVSADASPIDFGSRAFIADPYPAYAELRRSRSPQWIEHEDRTGTEGIWLFGRYKQVAAILRDTQAVSKDVSRLVPADRVTAFDRMLLNLDPPEHTRMRAVIAPLFSVRQVARLESAIAAIVDELVGALDPGTEFDFMQSFAIPLPIRVVAGVIGVPPEDMPQLKQWTDDMITGLDSATAGAEARERVGRSMAEMTGYLRSLIQRDRQPEGSLLDHVAIVQREVGMPTSDEVLSLCLLMVLAGHETTVNLLGNGLLTLARHPDQLRRLRGDPSLVPSSIEEMLRYESPLQRGTFRITVAPYRIGGQTFEPGQQLSAVMGAANRDPEAFDQPDRFDIGRRPNRHLAFGKGVHKCLGERLAKAEARIAFSKLLNRFAEVHLLDDTPDWQEKTLFRGLRTLRVRLTA